MRTCTALRLWAASSSGGGLLALLGFFLPWLLAPTGLPGGVAVSGWRAILGLLTVGQAQEDFPLFTALVLTMVLLPLIAALVSAGLGLLALAGKTASWVPLAQRRAASAGVFLTALNLAFFEAVFAPLGQAETSASTMSWLIPGVGIWLMLVGFLAVLVSSLLLCRSR